MNIFVHRMLGHYLQDEAQPDGQPAGSAPAPAAQPAAAPAATDAPAPAAAPAQADTMLGAQIPPVVPEAYTFEPMEGFELDQEVLGEFTGIAKELGMSQENASKLIGLQAKLMEKIEAQRTESINEALEWQRNEWAAQVKNDPEIGGDKFDATRAVAAKAVQAFGSDQLRALLNESGLGNHPEMVKLFHRIGTSLTEDKLVMPGTQSGMSSGGNESIVSAFYPQKAN